MSDVLCTIKDDFFKSKARQLNLSEAALDKIVQAYINETGDKETFPSDTYIKAQYAMENAVPKEDLETLTTIWQEHFSSPVIVNSLVEAVTLKDHASKYFKESATSIVPLNNGTFKVTVASPRLASSKKVETSKGPIVYNEEQKAAIDATVKHINDVRAGKTKQKFFTIQGKAGTGKTTIVNEILNRMHRGTYGRPIVIMGALSHKATTVLKDKISPEVAKNFDLQNKTIAGMLGLRPTNEGTFEPVPGKVPPIRNASVVFIDEASMVDEEQLELIKEAIKERNIPIIFLGDKGQLPPVRAGRYYNTHKISSDKLSPIFEDESIPKAELVTRVRQGEDSPVLDYADSYWNFSQGKTNKYPNDLHSKSSVTDKGALIVQRAEVDLVQQLMPLFQEAKRTGNPNLVKIVPYTNNSKDSKLSAVDKYNERIRKALYPDADTDGFMIGDLIIFNDTYGNEISSIPNSLESAIISIRPCESSLPKFEGVELEEVEREYISFKTPDGIATVPALIPTRENRARHQRNLSKIANYCKNNKFEWPKFWEYKNLYAANVGYAYAIDSHKSQGSTYDVVAVDAADINSVQPTTLKTKAQSIYTALTRASNVTIVSSNTTNESTVYTDIKGINDRINSVKNGTADDSEFIPATEEDIFPDVTEDDVDKLIKNPNKKTSKVKKKGDIREEEYSDVIEKADTPDYDEDEEEDADDLFNEDAGEDEVIEKRPAKKEKTETPQEKTYREFVAAQKQLNSIIKFKKKDHVYYVNGRKADFSVTEFKDFVLGIERDSNDFLEISSRLGDTHDSFLRDYFAGTIQEFYPNLNDARIAKLKVQAAKLEALLVKTYGEDAIFITDEDLLRTAGIVKYDGEEYTVAGTMDMVVIDSKGDIYIIDFKTKRANKSEELDDDKIEEYAIQVSMYKAFVSSNPLFKTRVKKSQIAQFNLKYADPRIYEYTFKGDQIYIDIDGKSIRLEDAEKEGKYAFTTGAFNNKLRGLSVDLEEAGIEVEQLKTNIQKGVEHKEVADETRVDPKKGTGKMVEFFGKQKRPDIKAVSTLGAILEGKRTATTRVKHWDYWKKFKVGDIITFEDSNGKTVDVRITVAPHKINKNIDLDEWSKKEGWTKDRFTNTEDKFGKTLMDYAKEGKAFQMEYELVEKENPSSIEVSSYSKKYEVLSNFGDKDFEVDDKTFPTVEHYFQWAKAIHCKDFAMANKIKKAVSAKQAKYLGSHELNMTKEQQKSWDKISRKVMKKGMREAFEQNEDAKDLLLSTGTALLTHKLGGPFADILMELREEFGGAGKPTTVKEAEKKAKEDAKKSKEVPEAPTKKSESKSETSNVEEFNNANNNANDPERFAGIEESEETISSEKTILSNEELSYWNKKGVGSKPRILVGSERTDPAFHVEEILDIINGKKTVKEWGVRDGKRVAINEVSGHDFAGLYLITKHDGLPMLQLLQTKIPKLIHFSITSLGGTKWEPGVMKYNDLLDRIEDYIKQGLDPESVTIRIDPIVPGLTNKEDIENIVSRASNMGIKRIRFSIMDAYANTRKAMSDLGYDFDKYYGDKFFAKDEYIDDICNFMISLKDKYDVTLGTCAEAIAKKGISKEGCLSVSAVNNMLGTSIEDKGTSNNEQRKLCSCYGGKIDALQYNAKCASHCLYCYAKHESDTAHKYYNEDGTLINDKYTQSREPKSDLHIEKISDRYTPKITSDVEQLNTAAEALRKQGWHVEFYNKKSEDNSHSNEVMTISIEGNPKKGFFELEIDSLEEGGFSCAVHFKTKSKKAMNESDFAEEALEDSEKEDMFKALIYAIPDGGVVSTWGTLTKGTISALDSLARRSGGALQKIGDKLAKDSDNNNIRIPVYSKLTEEEMAEANIRKVRKAQVQESASKNLEKVQDGFFGYSEAKDDTGKFTSIIKFTVPKVATGVIGGHADSVIKSQVLALPYSTLVSLDTDVVNMNFLYALDELLKNPLLHIVPTETVITIDPNSAEGIAAKEYAKEGKRLQYDFKTGELKVPMFTVGYSISEIEKRAAANKLLNNDLLTQEELRSLSKAAMYKLSEFVTMIQSTSNGYIKLFGEKAPKADKDFTKMSRVQIIEEIGLKELLLKVQDRVFNPDKRPKDTPFDTLEKLDIIYDNWDAFVDLGYDALISLEEIAMDGNQRESDRIKNELNDDNEETEDIIQEIFGSSLEHWQVGFRQVSAFSSLSKLMKRTIDSLYELDAKGDKIYDEFGIAKHLNAQEAVSKILHFTQGAQSLDAKDSAGNLRANSMLYMLKSNLNSEPWLQQIIDLLEDQYNEEGDLIKKADEQFKAQFYSNFKKYFQKYAITFKDKKGNIHMKVINESMYADTLLKECQAKENSFAVNGFKLKTKTGEINKEILNKLKKAADKIKEFQEEAESMNKEEWLKSLNKKEYHKALKEVFDLLDIDIPSSESINNLFTVKKNLKDLSTKLAFLIPKIKDNAAITDIREYEQIVDIVSKEMGLEMESVTYESGKLYYSFVLPSYLGRLVTSLKGKNVSEEEYNEFLNKEYLRYRWFNKDGKVRCRWLDRLKRSETARRMFEHTTSLHYLGTDYTSKSPMEYIASMMRMFFYDNNKKWAYFRIPMLSNKPSEEYVRFERIHLNYKDTIARYMLDVFEQELDRIQAVKERQKNIGKDQKIVSKGKKETFDKRGATFVFEDYLNKYVDGTYKNRKEYNELTDKEKAQEDNFSKLLKAKLDGTINEKSDDYGKLETLFKIITTRCFEENYREARQQWVDEGFLTLNPDGTIQKLAGNLKLSEDELQEFFWNDAFAAIQILELTITDMAYYVDTEDLQKRLAQLHAPGMQAYIQARDKKGNLYTKDGKERTIYIKDDMVKSSVLANLDKARKQILADTPKDRKVHVARQLDSIIKAFESINFADAQGYSCPSSYRKKMGIFGNWDDRMEDAYEKVTHPEKYPDVNLSEMLDVLWQPLKPFVYTQIAKPGYNDVLPELKVSVQNKNSEYVLVIADAILQSAGMPNKLRAIYEFMEESQHNPDGTLNGEGIDTVQFMSAVNAGCMGVIDLNDTMLPNGTVVYKTEEEIKEALSKAYEIGEDGKITYSPDYVHEIPFEDYIIQQNVPAHFMEHEQAHGSQDRILTFADMLDVDPLTGNTNYLTIDGKQVSVAEAKKNYFDAIAENIEDSKKELIRRFKLDSGDPRAVNVAISKALKDEIRRDSRYGSDLLWACDTNEYGEFNIPLSDPIQSTRIQQLLNSIIKNTINKQEIAGGPVVQVSNWGTSHKLHIRFKNSDGQILLTEEEFNELKNPFPNEALIPRDYYAVDEDGNRKWQPAEDYDKYNDYAGKEVDYTGDQAGVAYFEAYATIPDENFAKDFMKKDANGNEYIDIEEIEKTNPDLLSMIGYRIPTESKYSMVPIKIIGFLPRIGGEGLMLPADITSLAGSDFDIDKEYIMRYVFDRVEKDGKVTYEKPKSGRGYRNNLIISTQLAVLQSEQVQKQLFTPGNFDEPKKYGYLISYVQNEASRTGRDPEDIWKEAMAVGSKMSVDDFNDWLKEKNKAPKNLIFNNVQVQFHKQNMTAAKLIGIFAQANVSHAFISLGDNPYLVIPAELQFKINDIEVGNGETESNVSTRGFLIDEVLTKDRSINISNNLAALLAASVDAVKDPILNLINININTANIVTSMLRMGFSLQTVSLIASQPVIKNLIRDYAIKRADHYVDIKELITETLDEMPPDVLGVSDIRVTDEDLIANLNGDNVLTNYMVLKIFSKMQEISDIFGDITHMTRYNSITSAVGPFASDTMLQRIKDEAFYSKVSNGIIGASVRDACDNPILRAFRDDATYVERRLLGEHLIQAGGQFEKALRTLGRTLGYSRGVPSEVANAFSDFYMSFYVNDNGGINGSVFDLSYENRKRVLTQFPQDFLKLKKKYKDNLLINSIQYVESEREQYPFLQLKTRGLTPTVLEDIKNAWISLYNNPDSRDLALALVEYNYFRGSFGFSPKTFMNLVPNVIKNNLNNYIRVLNTKDSRTETTSKLDRIINQFILHNHDLIIDRYRKLENYNPIQITHDVYGECISINREPEDEKKKKYRIKISRPFISIDDKTYFVVNYTEKDVILKEVDELGGRGQGFELSVDEDFPKSVFDQNSSTSKGKKSSDSGEDSFISISEEQAGVLIDQLFKSDEDLKNLGDLKIKKAIDKINEKAEEAGYNIRLAYRGRIEKTLLSVLDNIEGVDNPREILNGAKKTIKDLNLCG